MKLIVGLGNPGEKYAHTRHNIGYDVVDKLISDLGSDNKKEKFQGKVSETVINGEKILFLQPLTFMNLSGDSVNEAATFYKLDPKSDILIIHDDMDLPIGKLRIREKGSSGGHNGLKSIISHVGTDFYRIKCGIGHPQGNDIDFVLGTFSKDDRKIIDEMIDTAAKAVKDFIDDLDGEKLMQKYNKK